MAQCNGIANDTVRFLTSPTTDRNRRDRELGAVSWELSSQSGKVGAESSKVEAESNKNALGQLETANTN